MKQIIGMKKKSSIIFAVVSLFFTFLFLSVLHRGFSEYQRLTSATPKKETKSIEYFLGYPLDTLDLVEGKVKRGQFFSSIMSDFNVSYDKIIALAQASKEIFDVRKMIAGSNYYLLCSSESKDPKVFIYEKNPAEYMVFHLTDTLQVKKLTKKTETKELKISGYIKGSLYESIQKSGGDPSLAVALSEVFAWTIDFHRLQEGDAFEVIFDETFTGNTSLGIESVIAAKLTHKSEDFYAFEYNKNGKVEYFDQEGKSLKKAFLKAPVKFSRISSHYNLKRFHPVQKRFKAHLGTDYAAPSGTPIMAVGNGVVLEAKYSRFNGNYVKIKHNNTYTTQYLHMSKFAKGIRSGTHVKQGDVIGYVGSTGLSSGPHVCFRFWKNGKQVNHLSEKFIPSEPIPQKELNAYKSAIQSRYTWLKDKNTLSASTR